MGLTTRRLSSSCRLGRSHRSCANPHLWVPTMGDSRGHAGRRREGAGRAAAGRSDSLRDHDSPRDGTQLKKSRRGRDTPWWPKSLPRPSELQGRHG